MREHPVIRAEEAPLESPNARFFGRGAILFWIVAGALVIVWLLSWMMRQSINTDGPSDNEYPRSQRGDSHP